MFVLQYTCVKRKDQVRLMYPNTGEGSSDHDDMHRGTATAYLHDHRSATITELHTHPSLTSSGHHPTALIGTTAALNRSVILGCFMVQAFPNLLCLGPSVRFSSLLLLRIYSSSVPMRIRWWLTVSFLSPIDFLNPTRWPLMSSSDFPSSINNSFAGLS